MCKEEGFLFSKFGECLKVFCSVRWEGCCVVHNIFLLTPFYSLEDMLQLLRTDRRRRGEKDTRCSPLMAE